MAEFETRDPATATASGAPAGERAGRRRQATLDDGSAETAPPMSRAHRIANLVGVILPFLGLIAAVVLLWNRAVDWIDLAIMALMYLIAGFGVTVGYHRLFTHRSFQTYRPIQYAFAVAGSMSLQGSVIAWVADHRKHHAHTDREGDPHSPHVGHGSGLSGLWHAHTGWLFEGHGRADPRRYARDLWEDSGMRAIDRAFPWLTLLTFAIPFALGWALHGAFVGALTGLLWGGLVRTFFLHHITWSVNSVCHYFGRRRFAVDDESTNVPFLSLVSFGESWHHNHHTFPRSAAHGLRWWELDIGAWLIRGLERLGLAWNVVRISPERQRQLAAAAE
jgi:stearoyl-CoA desaturase (Delta-9 desaturase)